MHYSCFFPPLATGPLLSCVPHPLFLCVTLQVVEIALKVSPILGAHMFQPLLPAVFRGIVDGEVSLTSFFFLFCTDLVRSYPREQDKPIFTPSLLNV